MGRKTTLVLRSFLLMTITCVLDSGEGRHVFPLEHSSPSVNRNEHCIAPTCNYYIWT